MKKTYCIVLILLSLTSVSIAQNGWYQLTMPNNIGLYGVYFKDVNSGIIYRNRTSDGGQSWTQIMSSGGYAMHFPIVNTGWKVGGGIQKTTNFGTNWITQPNSAGGILYGVCFIDANTGYTCGGNADILKTTNGGVNWIILNSGLSSSNYFKGISFRNANTGFAVSHEFNNHTSTIVKTTNGGLNFIAQTFPSGTFYEGIFFINDNTGFIVGEGIRKTVDNGNTWNIVPYNGSLYLMDVYFPSSTVGYSVGWGGTIIKTTDGGDTWFEQSNSLGGDLNHVFFINDNTGFIAGGTGGSDGVALKTTDGGGPPIGITPVSNEVPEKFSLSQNYPNPFNPATNINFSIPKKSFVKIIIYDALGRKIDELVNFQLNAGTYKVDWSGVNFASGVYYYQLTTDSYTETKRMLMIK